MANPRLDANDILALLAVMGSLSATEIAAAVKQPRKRKCVINRLGCLMKHRLIERAKEWEKRSRAIGERGDVAFYRITAAGRAFVKSGKRVKCGRQGPLNGTVPPRGDTLRQHLWKTIRIVKKFTVPDLVEASVTGGDAKIRRAQNGAHIYLKALRRAGIIALLPVREQGAAVTSNGFHRYSLVRDLGLIAPSTRAQGLFDHNSKETIPYLAEAAR